MKKFLVLFAFLFSTVAFAQTDPSSTPTDCTNAFFKGMLDEDATTIGKITTDDFAITSYDGMQADKDLMMQGVSGGFVMIETATVSGLRVRSYNDNAAIVTGMWKAKGAIQGTNFDNEIAFGAMCVKIAGNWRVANVQFTAMR